MCSAQSITFVCHCNPALRINKLVVAVYQNTENFFEINALDKN